MCAGQKAPSFRIEDILNFKSKTNRDFPKNYNNDVKPDTKNSLDPNYIRGKTLEQPAEYTNSQKLDISITCATLDTSETQSLQSKQDNTQSFYFSASNIDPPNSVNVIRTVKPFPESQKSVDLAKYSDKPQQRNLNSVYCSSQSLTPGLSERLFNNKFTSSSERDLRTLRRESSEKQSHPFLFGFHNNVLPFVPRESAFKYTSPYYDNSVMSSLRNGFNYFSECSPSSEQASMLRQGFSGRYYPQPLSYYPYGLDRGQGACGFWPMSLGKRKGGQVRFSAQQTAALERRFLGNKYLSPEDRRALATSLKLTDRQVKTWFQNRRAKWRRTNNLSPDEKSEVNSEDESVSDRDECETPCDT